jgi:two-component system chemotaxis response regulator CheB
LLVATPNLIVIGGSAGAIEALLELVPQFPAEIDAAICIVVHFPADSPSLLPQLLRRHTKLSVSPATEGAELKSGQIYIAPPDWHLLIEDHTCRLSHGPREHGYRPSIDAMFRTAAEAFGTNTVGVILSGSLDDGSAGLRHIRLRGGRCVVQDPSDATFPGMPTNAMRQVNVDRSVAISQMGQVLLEIVDRLKPSQSTSEEIMASSSGKNPDPAAEGMVDAPDPENALETSIDQQRLVLRCPECGGVLQETTEDGLPGFRCRVGHNFSLLSLLEAQGMALEQELWSAFNGFLERIDLCRRLSIRANDEHQHEIATEFAEKARDAKEAADVLRDFLLRGTLFNRRPTEE